MSKEVFDFSAGIKKKLAIAFISGVVLLLAGWMLSSTGGHEEEHSEDDHTELAEADDHGTDHDAAETMEAEHHEGDDGHVAEAGEHEAEEEHEKGWFDRVVIDLWINNVYFTGLALIGLFFFAIQYAAQAGWSTYILRIPLSMAS